MRRTLALGALALVALGGCGGGGDDKPQSSTTGASAPNNKDALAAWDEAAHTYWQAFGDCGTQATPTKGFYASCTKDDRQAFHAAARKALAQRPSCAKRKQLIARVQSRLDGAVTALDRQNDATLAHRKYRGTPVQAFYSQATQSLELDVPAARALRC
jgi:hypothetical protein